ncbi:uncharacterized protein LOC144174001 isoform X2 [Haemaphysalis longicornis]
MMLSHGYGVDADMPDKCCVPKCRGNYASENKVHIFKFPKEEDLRQAWLRAIPRENLVVTEYTRVCELHFKYDDVLREDSYVDSATGRTVTAPLFRPRLRPGAVPSKFPDMPMELAVREDPNMHCELRSRLDTLATAAFVSSMEETDRVLHLRDLADYVRLNLSAFWHAIEDGERLILIHIVEKDVPWIKYSVVVKSDLTLSCHFVKTPIKKLGSNVCIPTVAKSKRRVMELLENIERWDCCPRPSSENADEGVCEAIHWLLGKLSGTQTEDKAHAIQFLREQLELLSRKKERMHYSAELMVFSCILFMISPRAYKYIRNYGAISLPHPTTVRSMCVPVGANPQSARDTATFLSNMAKRIFDLDQQERFVTVMVDELDIEDYFESKVNNNAGSMTPPEIPNSAFVFTVQSLTGQFKEVAYIVPAFRADAKFVHKLLKDVICGLEKIGYSVLCVVTDNDPVRRKAMSYFSSPPTDHVVYPHPSDSARSLFFVINPAYIIKSIRNDWLDQKNEKLCFFFPEFQMEAAAGQPSMLSASFTIIREALKLADEDVLLQNLRPPKKALCPSEVERENTRLALGVFSSSLSQMLYALARKHEQQYFGEAASFIDIIVKWWKVVSVKSLCQEEGQRDPFQEPVFPVADDPKVGFLYKILEWLDGWKAKNLDNGMLSKEMHAALQHTTRAYLEIIRYGFSELNLPYILLGRVQTDNLRERFGRYKQLIGSLYHLSIRQLYEGENELWSQNTLPMVAADCSADAVANEECDEFGKESDTSRPSCAVAVTAEALSKIKDMMPVLVYVAGHAVYTTLKKMRCAKCRPALTVDKAITISVAQQHHDLVKELDREGLVFPTMFAVNAVAFSYVVVEQLLKQAEFFKMPNKRQVITDLTVGLLVNDESPDFDACEDGHTSEFVLKLVLWSSTDILLKNFFCVISSKSSDDGGEEDKDKEENLPKKRRRKAPYKLKKRLPRLNCEHCEFFTDCNETLMDHYAGDHKEHALSTCETCQARFTHQAYLLMHKAQVHNLSEKERPQMCSLCDLTLDNAAVLVDHLRKVHAPGPTYSCIECLERFATKALLLQHRSEAHNPKLRKCPHCPKKFKNSWLCREHILRSHRSSRLPNSCKRCFRRYKDIVTLRYHMAIAHMHELSEEEKASLEPLKKHCTECDYATFDRRSMVGHMRRKHGEMLECPSCPRKFAHPWELTRHKRLKHSSAGHKECPHCLRVFACPKTFAVHLTMHEEGQGYECPICKRMFESDAMLSHHSKSHTGTGSRRCKECLRFFPTTDRLAKHQETYSMKSPDGTVVLTCNAGKTDGQEVHQKKIDDWPFACDQCHLRFKYESSLTAHKMSAHEKKAKGGKPFTCEICQKSFVSVLGLSSHIRTHTGERPFECPECGATFGQKSSLRDHKLLKHSRAFRFHCPLCSKGCISNYTLRKHLQAAHKALPPGATPIPPRRSASSAASASGGAGGQPTAKKSRAAAKGNAQHRPPPPPADTGVGMNRPGPSAPPTTSPARGVQQAAPARMCRPPGVPTSSAGPVPPAAAAASNPSAYLLPYLENQQQAYEARVRQAVVGGGQDTGFQGAMPPPPQLTAAPPHGAPAAGGRFGMDTTVGSGWRLPTSTVSGFELIYSPQPAHHEQAMASSLPPTHGLNWPHGSQ